MPLGDGGSTARLRDVADLLDQHLAPGDPLRAYPNLLRDPALSGQVLRGYLTGSIDAVLRVGPPDEPRFVVVDYKTNRLSESEALSVDHYRQDAMAREMMRSHYPLQAILYSVALHRFLAQRSPGYRPEVNLGGIGYLFVRGMAGRTTGANGGETGVFSWRPPSRLVVALSDLLAGRGAEP